MNNTHFYRLTFSFSDAFLWATYDKIVRIVARNALKVVDCMFGNYKSVCLIAGKKKVGNSDHFFPQNCHQYTKLD